MCKYIIQLSIFRNVLYADVSYLRNEIALAAIYGVLLGGKLEKKLASIHDALVKI